jgi:hypothetical protein
VGVAVDATELPRHRDQIFHQRNCWTEVGIVAIVTVGIDLAKMVVTWYPR